MQALHAHLSWLVVIMYTMYPIWQIFSAWNHNCIIVDSRMSHVIRYEIQICLIRIQDLTAKISGYSRYPTDIKLQSGQDIDISKHWEQYCEALMLIWVAMGTVWGLKPTVLNSQSSVQGPRSRCSGQPAMVSHTLQAPENVASYSQVIRFGRAKTCLRMSVKASAAIATKKISAQGAISVQGTSRKQNEDRYAVNVGLKKDISFAILATYILYIKIWKTIWQSMPGF